MKRTSKLTLLAATLMSAFALTSTSYAVPYLGSGALTITDTTFDNPNGSSTGTGIHFYDMALQFTVDISGAYVFEMASFNTVGTPSNALDTFIRIYANSFNPLSPATNTLGFQDDFTGVLTVLGGPNGTGLGGARPASRTTLNLVAGTTYFFIATTFRSTDFVSTTTTAQATGAYDFGINGPGTVSVVPEPGTTALVAIAGLGLVCQVLRKRRQA
jgi:hypothetical protein